MLPAKYTRIGRQMDWVARTRDISSHGVFVLTEYQPVFDARIRMRIDWPVPGATSPEMVMVVEGRVLRIEPGGFALIIVKHKFTPKDQS